MKWTGARIKRAWLMLVRGEVPFMITRAAAIRKIIEHHEFVIQSCDSVNLEIEWMTFPDGRLDVCLVGVALTAEVGTKREDLSELFAIVQRKGELHCCFLLSGMPRGGSFQVRDVHIEKRRAHCGTGQYLVMRMKALRNEEKLSQTFSFSGNSEGEWLMPLANITGKSATGR